MMTSDSSVTLKPKNVIDLGLDIKTHLCNSCVHKFSVCEELQYAYGSGEGEREGMPNICACDSFDPNIVGRSTKPEGEELSFTSIRGLAKLR